MKQYLIKLDNGFYFINQSSVDYEIGDRFANGTIVQEGILLSEHGQFYSISKTEES